MTESDMPVRVAGLFLTDTPDGLAIHHSDGEWGHFLNPVASVILLLCNGAHDARSIASILKEEFSLDEAPIDDVLACLTELHACGLITRSR
ncbi:PqqD family protein [Aestuariivirga sp.]|uniref:PqqD family protein n=1 Tax=Aestuariivirga sp. TaxID=2650926 RepID=UPI00391873D3